MTERDLEDILERYPELIEDGLALEGRQVPLGRRHVDLVFRDKYGQRLIIELKQGTILREHIGQIFEYEGDFLTPEDPNVRVMLIGNRVPPNLRRSLEHHGFEWREFTLQCLATFLRQKNDSEFLEHLHDEQQSAVNTISARPTEVASVPVPDKPKTWEKFYFLFGDRNLGTVFSCEEVKEMMVAAFPGTNTGSVIPSDYCYNIVNADSIRFRHPHWLFQYLGHSAYKVLGKDYPYVGPILWKGRKVGEWKGKDGPVYTDSELLSHVS